MKKCWIFHSSSWCYPLLPLPQVCKLCLRRPRLALAACVHVRVAGNLKQAWEARGWAGRDLWSEASTRSQGRKNSTGNKRKHSRRQCGHERTFLFISKHFVTRLLKLFKKEQKWKCTTLSDDNSSSNLFTNANI